MSIMPVFPWLKSIWVMPIPNVKIKGKMCNRPCENRIDYIGYKYMHFVESSRKTS